MAVSANTLFHFTSFYTLKKILTSNGFWPQYSLEYFHNALPKTSSYLEAYIPMVCFCDLKLTQLSDLTISKHTKDFGSFGIGFKKSWGINNKISPVSYIHQNSVASSTIDKIVKSINKTNSALTKSIAEDLGEIVKFLKPYKGKYQKGEPSKKIINYYDEREWRFIPNDSKYGAFPINAITKAEIQSLNLELRKKPLSFGYTDIKYIIIEKNDEQIKQELASLFDKIYKGKTHIKTDLISKIISLEQLKEDF